MPRNRRRQILQFWPLMKLGYVVLAVIAVAALCVVAFAHVNKPTAAEAGPIPTFTSVPQTTVPRIAFLGDSWTCGGGLTVEGKGGSANGFAGLTAKRLGWPYDTMCVGGSGYTTDYAKQTNFATRVQAVIDYKPDVVVVQGSTNDKAPETEIETRANEVLAAIHQGLPVARVYAMGAFYTPGNDRAVIDSARQAVAAAADANGAIWIDPASEGWLDLGTDFNPDGYHPNEQGHAKIATKLAALLKAQIPTT